MRYVFPLVRDFSTDTAVRLLTRNPRRPLIKRVSSVVFTRGDCVTAQPRLESTWVPPLRALPLTSPPPTTFPHQIDSLLDRNSGTTANTTGGRVFLGFLFTALVACGLYVAPKASEISAFAKSMDVVRGSMASGAKTIDTSPLPSAFLGHDEYYTVDRCVMYTYYGKGLKVRDALVVDQWRTSWKNAGWKPVVLDERHAQIHPRYLFLKNAYVSLPLGGDLTSRLHSEDSLLRYLALAAVGGGYMSEPDVFNVNLPPPPQCDYLPNQGQFTTHELFIPALVSGDSASLLHVAEAFATAPPGDIKHATGAEYLNDVVFFSYFYQVRPCAFPKSARRTVSSPSVTSTAVIRRRYCIHHIRTVLHKLVTVQTDYPSLLSIHRRIHRPIQYTHTRRLKTDTLFYFHQYNGLIKTRKTGFNDPTKVRVPPCDDGGFEYVPMVFHASPMARTRWAADEIKAAAAVGEAVDNKGGLKGDSKGGLKGEDGLIGNKAELVGASDRKSKKGKTQSKEIVDPYAVREGRDGSVDATKSSFKDNAHTAKDKQAIKDTASVMRAQYQKLRQATIAMCKPILVTSTREYAKTFFPDEPTPLQRSYDQEYLCDVSSGESFCDASPAEIERGFFGIKGKGGKFAKGHNDAKAKAAAKVTGTGTETEKDVEKSSTKDSSAASTSDTPGGDETHVVRVHDSVVDKPERLLTKYLKAGI
jgi:hypothetical protein